MSTKAWLQLEPTNSSVGCSRTWGRTSIAGAFPDLLTRSTERGGLGDCENSEEDEGEAHEAHNKTRHR
jgi:hypothetical protein